MHPNRILEADTPASPSDEQGAPASAEQIQESLETGIAKKQAEDTVEVETQDSVDIAATSTSDTDEPLITAQA